jgi:hypothetical protein
MGGQFDTAHPGSSVGGVQMVQLNCRCKGAFGAVVVAGDPFELLFVVQVNSTERSATIPQDAHHTVFLFIRHSADDLDRLRDGFTKTFAQSEDLTTHSWARTLVKDRGRAVSLSRRAQSFAYSCRFV